MTPGGIPHYLDDPTDAELQRRLRVGPEQCAREDLGAALRALRERKDVTLTELAARTKIAKSHISKIETGKGNPTLATILKLVAELGGKLQLYAAVRR